MSPTDTALWISIWSMNQQQPAECHGTAQCVVMGVVLLGFVVFLGYIAIDIYRIGRKS